MLHAVKYFGIDTNDRISVGWGFTRSGYDAVGYLDCVCRMRKGKQGLQKKIIFFIFSRRANARFHINDDTDFNTNVSMTTHQLFIL